MGKNKRTDKNYTREQKLVQENQKLKRMISAMRKELARIDIDRYGQVKDIIEEHYREEDKVEEGQNILDKLKEEWKCHKCTEGYLEIILFNKINDLHYFRKCTDCPNRTLSQKYDKNTVKGIVKKSS